jgi:hypothetical protein
MFVPLNTETSSPAGKSDTMAACENAKEKRSTGAGGKRTNSKATTKIA